MVELIHIAILPQLQDQPRELFLVWGILLYPKPIAYLAKDTTNCLDVTWFLFNHIF